MPMKPFKIPIICLNCSKEFLRAPYAAKRSAKHFCSRSCVRLYEYKTRNYPGMKKCSKCNKFLSTECFYRQKKGEERRIPRCKTCFKKTNKISYEGHKEHHQAVGKIKKERQISANRRIVRDYLLSHPCVDCGEKDWVVLQFDHVSSDKITTVGRMVRDRSAESLLTEISKCEVRCANCHVRITFKRANSWRVANTTQDTTNT